MLRELLKKKLAQAKALQDKVAAESREYTDDEAEELQALSAECNKLKAQIEAEDSLAAMQLEQTQSAGRKTSPSPLVPGNATAKGPDAEDTRGFKDIADFAQAVISATAGQGIDNRLYAAGGDGMSNNGAAGEGFMVPPAFSTKMIEIALQDNADLLGEVDSEPTNSNQVEVPADESTPWSPGGIDVRWRNEKSQMQASGIETQAREVKLHQLYAFTRLTEELLEDAPRLASRLSKKAPEAIRWKLNEAIRYGSGVGQMLGFMASKALVTVKKESGQTEKLKAENIAKMLSALLPSSITRAHWEINPELLATLMTLNVNGQTIWTPPATGFANAPGGFLLGRPIRFTEHAKEVGAAGDIQLIDPQGYYMAHKSSGLKFDQSMHLFFDTNEQALRWTFRAGGQPKLSKPVDAAHGSGKRSHFVTLEAR